MHQPLLRTVTVLTLTLAVGAPLAGVAQAQTRGFRDRAEDVRDRREDRLDRRENRRDHREDTRDTREDVRDAREDVRDAQHYGGARDRNLALQFPPVGGEEDIHRQHQLPLVGHRHGFHFVDFIAFPVTRR